MGDSPKQKIEKCLGLAHNKKNGPRGVISTDTTLSSQNWIGVPTVPKNRLSRASQRSATPLDELANESKFDSYDAPYFDAAELAK